MECLTLANLPEDSHAPSIPTPQMNEMGCYANASTHEIGRLLAALRHLHRVGGMFSVMIP
jgi:hypothetical protein